jgi:hypothetical protein
MPFGEVHRWRGRSGVFIDLVASCGPPAVIRGDHSVRRHNESVDCFANRPSDDQGDRGYVKTRTTSKYARWLGVTSAPFQPVSLLQRLGP